MKDFSKQIKREKLSVERRCIHHNQMVNHICWTGTQKPNCRFCDGYGKMAKLYEWRCHTSNSIFPKYSGD